MDSATLVPAPSSPLMENRKSPTRTNMPRAKATLDLNKMPPEGSFGRALLTTLRCQPDAHIVTLRELLRDRKARLLLPLSAFPHPPNRLQGDEHATKSQLEDHIILSQRIPDVPEQVFVTLSGLVGRIGSESLKVNGRVPNANFEPTGNWDDFYVATKAYTDSFPPGEIEACSTVLYSDVEIPVDPVTALCVIVTEPVADPSGEDRAGGGTTDFSDVAMPVHIVEEVNSIVEKLKKDRQNGRSPDFLSADLQGLYVRLADKLAPHGSDTVAQNPDTRQNVDHAKAEIQLEQIEQYICNRSYDVLFPRPGFDDWKDDEQLESRIAALNILDINLQHLGVSEIQGLGNDAMANLVKRVGADLQKLVNCRTPSEKLAIIVNCHKLIVTALDVAQSSALSEPPPIPPRESVPTSSARNEECPAAQDGAPPTPSSPVPPRPNSEDDGQRQPELTKRPRFSSADLLLPLLIYVVVKSNPPRLVSNLRFIQRYRNRALVKGEVSYCLTNICAVVSFLENVDLAALGLSRPEMVLLNEIDVLQKAAGNDNAGVLLANRVGKEIAGVAEGVAGAGSKVFTGVVDMSSKVLGRLTFWGGGANNSPTPSARSDNDHSLRESRLPDSSQNRLMRRLSLASKGRSRSNEEVTRSVGDREMKKMSVLPPATTNDPRRSEAAEDKEARASPPHPYPGEYPSDSAGSHDPPLRPFFETVASVLNDVPPAIERFLECEAEDIRLGEIPELLRDYRRLGNVVEALRRGTWETNGTDWTDRRGG